jgi:2-haloacid dehalogenase
MYFRLIRFVVSSLRQSRTTHMAAKELGIATESLLMVAVHSWDIAGAAEAGCATAFLARPGQVLDTLTPPPNFVASNLRDLADQLLATKPDAA